MVTVRREVPADMPGVRMLNEMAFGQRREADLVDTIRSKQRDLLSLVAEDDGKIVGHILFSPAGIEGPHGVKGGMALAPLAVLPGMQRQGIGTQLVRQGIEERGTARCPFVIVLGHAAYYTRSGFERASWCGIRCPGEGVPDDAFMVLWLDRSLVGKVSGIASYLPELSETV
jgi:putative acetyltransferase